MSQLDLSRIDALYNCELPETLGSKEAIVKKNLIAIDTETTGLNTWDPKVVTTHVSFYTNKGKGNSYEVGNHDDKIMALNERCNRPDTTVIFFNAKFDMAMLSKIGFKIKNPIIDSLLMAQLVLADDKSRKLKQLARKYLNDPCLEDMAMRSWLRKNKGKTQGQAPRHIAIPYSIADAKLTLELFHYLSSAIDEMKLWPVVEREMLLMPIVASMESYGVVVDPNKVKELQVKVSNKLSQLKSEAVKLTGNSKFNPNSTKQVVDAIFDGSVMPTRFSHATGKPKVDALALLESPSKLGSVVVEYRKVNKAKSTYIKPLLKTAEYENVLRAHFNQGGTRTGRFSSSGPNLQNIPRPDESILGNMRDCICPRTGDRLLFIDYKQIELRLTAHFSKQQHMLDAIRDGEDLHSKTCKLVFEKSEEDADWDIFRYISKSLNFAIIYGTGAQTARDSVLENTNGKINISVMDMASYIAEYKSKHPKIEELFTAVTDEVSKTGGIVNHYGRYMPVDHYKAYAGVNYKIQGTAADFLKLKMFQVSKFLKDNKLKSRMIMTIHDELVFNLVKEERCIVEQLAKLMQDYTTFDVPLECSFKLGKTWMQQKEIKLTMQG